MIVDKIVWSKYECKDCGKTTQYESGTGVEPCCAHCILKETKATVLVDKSLKCGTCKETVTELIGNMCNTCKSKIDKTDVINWPKHYNTGKIQPIEAIEDWRLDFRLANAVKYISRCEHKGKTKQDLEKAIWYIERYIKIELDKDVSNG